MDALRRTARGVLMKTKNKELKDTIKQSWWLDDCFRRVNQWFLTLEVIRSVLIRKTLIAAALWFFKPPPSPNRTVLIGQLHRKFTFPIWSLHYSVSLVLVLYCLWQGFGSHSYWSASFTLHRQRFYPLHVWDYKNSLSLCASAFRLFSHLHLKK